jgi:hypothetical protein
MAYGLPDVLSIIVKNRVLLTPSTSPQQRAPHSVPEMSFSPTIRFQHSKLRNLPSQ